MIVFLLALRVLVRSIGSGLRDPTFQVLFALFGVLLAVGCVFYTIVEGWSLIDALYFCVASMSTVGYGDITPQTTEGKLFTIVYLLLGTGTFVAMAAKLATTIVTYHTETRKWRHRSETPTDSP